jgi:hypothetical protein
LTERVDIANICLSLLGQARIEAFEDESTRAEQLRIQYIPARDATLEAHDWSFAIERFMPGLLTEKPVYGAGNMFAVPSNILRVIACDNPAKNTSISNLPINSLEQIDWVLENGNIVCNESVVYARGVRRVEDEGSFSPLFVQAFAAQLAMLLAINLTASADVQERVSQYYAYAINQAKTRDGLQGRSRRLRSRTMLKSR